MSDRNDGGPAFPTQRSEGGRGLDAPEVTVTDDPGMTLRDYFAAKAMQAIVSDDKWDLEVCSIASHNGASVESVRAHFAYAQADAMLKAREE